jgi:hypothetical protein
MNFNFINFSYFSILDKGLNLIFSKIIYKKINYITTFKYYYLLQKLNYYADILKLSLYRKKIVKKYFLSTKLYNKYYIVNFLRFKRKKNKNIYY